MKPETLAQIILEGPAYASASEDGVETKRVSQILALNCTAAELEFALYISKICEKQKRNPEAVLERLIEKEVETAALEDARVKK